MSGCIVPKIIILFSLSVVASALTAALGRLVRAHLRAGTLTTLYATPAINNVTRDLAVLYAVERTAPLRTGI